MNAQTSTHMCIVIWAATQEILSWGGGGGGGGLRTTKAQTSLRICLLESILSRLHRSEISIFYLVSIAEQAGFNFTLSETPKTGFLATRASKTRICKESA